MLQDLNSCGQTDMLRLLVAVASICAIAYVSYFFYNEWQIQRAQSEYEIARHEKACDDHRSYFTEFALEHPTWDHRAFKRLADWDDTCGEPPIVPKR
jgi:hypothetical protein